MSGLDIGFGQTLSDDPEVRREEMRRLLNGPDAARLPRLFDDKGYRLGQAVFNNRFQGPSSGLYAVMAIHAAREQSADVAVRVRDVLGALDYRFLPGDGVLQPNAIRFNSRTGGRLYAVAGTTNLLQWANYLIPGDERGTPGVPGRIYPVFADLAEGGYATIANDARQYPRGEAIAIVGHSLGGALAELWAHKLVALEGFSDLGSTTYGAPRFGDEVYAAAHVTNVDTERVVSDGDVVANILPSTFVGSSRTRDGRFAVPITNFGHRDPRFMKWGEENYGREYQAAGSFSRNLDDLAEIFSNLGSVISHHKLATYGRRALRRSFISDANGASPQWQRDSNSLAISLFGA